MKLYAGTSEQFRADTQMHRIAEKLRAEYTAQIGHKPSPNEVHAWQNSLMALSLLLDQAELNDHGVILEYQLGNTSRRLDAMLTGHAASSAENAVVVELKQWSEGSIGPSTADNCVELYVGKQVRRVLHPSVQVGGYQQWLLDSTTSASVWQKVEIDRPRDSMVCAAAGGPRHRHRGRHRRWPAHRLSLRSQAVRHFTV